MAVALLPVCSNSKAVIRDGQAGPFARLLLPFYTYGYWFASGQQYTFPNSTIAQDPSLTMQGTSKPDTFSKGPGICIG